ncbi:MAG: transglycosylase SLT domain-containing protein [bacterium]|nr:transglycosylase SLT domain-containing protein [bacterium]
MTQEVFMRYLPAWALLGIVAIMIAPRLLFFTVDTAFRLIGAIPGVVVDVGEGALHAAGDVVGGVVQVPGKVVAGVGDLFAGDTSEIAPLFTNEVDYWENHIAGWAEQYALDPNLLATVMQIESCGHPTISSYAGAQGLFQVMPFHFSSDENQLDPDTNALRGANFLNYCLDASNGDTGLAMACYNGGPSVLSKNFSQWPEQTQRYFNWGTGIYGDAQSNSSASPTLDRWLAAGGGTMCEWAADELNIN